MLSTNFPRVRDYPLLSSTTPNEEEVKLRGLSLAEKFDPASLCLVANVGQERVYPFWDRMTHYVRRSLQSLIDVNLLFFALL